MIRFQAPQIPALDEVGRYFAPAEQARWYSNGGPCHELLVERLREHLGGRLHPVPVSSGTVALMVALRALVGSDRSGGEVLMPSFTFPAPALAVMWAGLTPVFVDIDPDSWHPSAESLELGLEQRGQRVAAVLGCSTFGLPPAPELSRCWEGAAQQAGVPLLVDSAAGFGSVTAEHRRLGHQGDAEIFSFHATKPFAIGEGGLVCTEDPELAARISRLTNFGFEGGTVVEQGLNAKLAEWPAATALAVLDRFESVLSQRRQLAAVIQNAFLAAGFHAPDCTGQPAWQFVPVAAPSPGIRNETIRHARERGIEVRAYFDTPLHRMPAFASAPIVGALTCTEDLAGRVVSLPMANDLNTDDLEQITSLASTEQLRAAPR